MINLKEKNKRKKDDKTFSTNEMCFKPWKEKKHVYNNRYNVFYKNLYFIFYKKGNMIIPVYQYIFYKKLSCYLFL